MENSNFNLYNPIIMSKVVQLHISVILYLVIATISVNQNKLIPACVLFIKGIQINMKSDQREREYCCLLIQRGYVVSAFG